MCCTDNFVAMLSLDGNLHWCQNEADKMVPHKLSEASDINIVQLACSFNGHFIALTKLRRVYVWQVAEKTMKWSVNFSKKL